MTEGQCDVRRWYAGVDWARENHHVLLTDAAGAKIAEKIFSHSGAGLAELAAWLIGASGASCARQIDVAIETPHGPVVETLLERSFHVHAINPKQMDRFRDRFTLAGAKDDSRDAQVMASALRTDPHCFRPLAAADPTVIELREWSRIADELSAERTRLVNRLRQQLWRYFPAMLALDDDPGVEWLLDLWELAPTPDKARRLRVTSLAKLLKRNRIRRLDAAQALALLRQPALTVADGAVAAATAHIASLVPRLRLANRQIKQAHRQLDELTLRLIPAPETNKMTDKETSPETGPETGPGQEKQHDAEILASLPGVGRIVLATLLAEASDALQRRDYAALRSLSGVAPVTRRSGKSCVVIKRKACNGRLANAVYH